MRGDESYVLNKLWAGMILIGICFGAVTGHMGEISGTIIDSAKEAVSLSITMLGVVGAWSGVMKIAEDSGLLKEVERGLSPLIHFLFPQIPREHKSLEYITTNIVANLLWLGWGATPAGLKAMEELAKLEAERGNLEYQKMDITDQKHVLSKWQEREQIGHSSMVSNRTSHPLQQTYIEKSRYASSEMCTFLILNISSLQLIPVNMIAYRSQYGSANPTAVIAPAIMATFFSTMVAVVYCKVMSGKQRR